MNPWEKYQATDEQGPWSQYADKPAAKASPAAPRKDLPFRILDTFGEMVSAPFQALSEIDQAVRAGMFGKPGKLETGADVLERWLPNPTDTLGVTGSTIASSLLDLATLPVLAGGRALGRLMPSPVAAPIVEHMGVPVALPLEPKAPSAIPSITDLAKEQQYSVSGPSTFLSQPESVKSLESVGSTGTYHQPGIPTPVDPSVLAKGEWIGPGTDFAEVAKPGVQPNYLKPGFLQTAEERLHGNIRITGIEDKLSPPTPKWTLGPGEKVSGRNDGLFTHPLLEDGKEIGYLAIEPQTGEVAWLGGSGYDRYNDPLSLGVKGVRQVLQGIRNSYPHLKEITYTHVQGAGRGHRSLQLPPQTATDPFKINEFEQHLRERSIIASPEDRARAQKEVEQLYLKVEKKQEDPHSLPAYDWDNQSRYTPITAQPTDEIPGFKLPSRIVRGVVPDDAVTTLEQTGPLGKQAGALYRNMVNAREQQTMQGMVELEKIFDEHFGRQPAFAGKHLNPFSITQTDNIWKASQAEIKQLVDYLYSNGKTKADPPIIALANKIHDRVMGRASSHPGVREATVIGPHGNYPVGQVGMYYPHHPVTLRANALLDNRIANWAYEKAASREEGLSKSEFFRRLNQYTATGEWRREPGVESARLWDASFGGTESAYDNLKRLGYGVDPYRDIFNALKGLYGVGERNLIKGQLDDLENAMRESIKALVPTNPKKAQESNAWLTVMIERMKGTDMDIADKVIGDMTSNVINANNATLLQFATIQQFNQIIYPIQRAGLMSTVKAMFSVDADEIGKRSGALFAVYNQELAGRIDDVVGKAAQATLRINRFSSEDATLRLLAARTGDIQLHKLYGKLKVNPTDQSVRAQIREFQVDPDELLAGGLTDSHRLRGAQVFANQTQGRNTLEGLPLFMTDNRQLARLVKQFKNFLYTNSTELKRVIRGAVRDGVDPKVAVGRALRGVVAAEVVGELTSDLTWGLMSMDDPLQEKRVPKWMRDSMGSEVGRAVQNLVNGYAGIYFSIAASALQGKEESLLEFLSGPTVTTAVQAIARPIETAVRRLSGPLAPTISRQVKQSPDQPSSMDELKADGDIE